MNTGNVETLIETRMRSAGLAAPTIASFLQAVKKVREGETGLMPEGSVEPIASLPRLEEVAAGKPGSALLERLVVIKLNGGLGTGMGLERAKSLIQVKGKQTFLDFIARQVLALRHGTQRPAFYLMNSFSTQQETLAHLAQYGELRGQSRLDFLQSKVPKLDAQTLRPVSWPEQPELEWCPPGHGDIYPSLLACGLLDELLSMGITCAFVSNSDNLGATLDLGLAQFFADSGWSFLMEVAERTAADRKGGHLTRRRSDGRLALRESVQCPKEDEAAFQDIQKHRYFNTNNLWLRLDHLRSELERQGGAISLPLIKNAKTVDPRKAESTKVLQLESAMGAAIECFARAGAVVVPRSRFSPVKTTSDLLGLRSDAYVVTDDCRLVLHPARNGRPPVIDLDPAHYKLMPDFEQLFPDGPPSLVDCESLSVRGPVRFQPGVACRGRVAFVNPASETRVAGAGDYANAECRL